MYLFFMFLALYLLVKQVRRPKPSVQPLIYIVALVRYRKCITSCYLVVCKSTALSPERFFRIRLFHKFPDLRAGLAFLF
jgi:hypothetical protein